MTQRMNRALLCVVFCGFIMETVVVFSNEPARKDSDIFERYAIPKRLQKEEIKPFLLQMEWYAAAALADNWKQATLHPARIKEHAAWDRITLTYYYDFHRSKKARFLRAFDISHGSGEFYITELRFEGALGLSEDKKPVFFQNPRRTIYLGKNDNSGKFNFLAATDPKESLSEWYEYTIAWDAGGKIISDDYQKHGEEAWATALSTSEPDYWAEVKKTQKINPRGALCPPITFGATDPGEAPKHPKDTKFKRPLERCFDIYDAIHAGKVGELLPLAGLDAKEYRDPQIIFAFEKQRVRDVAVLQKGGYPRARGAWLSCDKDGRLAVCYEGDLLEIDPGNGTGNDPVTYIIHPDGRGIIVTFHATGYPATYTSVARNRLFGRQIKWDERGEVFSDTDLDFPQPWPDAPKVKVDK